MTETFEIFLVAAPGLETALRDEVLALGFADAKAVEGGVTVTGGWSDVWRANLLVRGASRVLARVGAFRVFHLAQLDKRARKFNWLAFLKPNVPVKVEVTCRKSKIYHSGAAAQRIARALQEEVGTPIADDAEVTIKARIEDDLCTISIDTSGEMLHRRGYKEAVNKAPMRETLASLFLQKMAYTGTEPVLDPMCGSGTFVIEAAEIAMGLPPGRTRSFAFELLAGFDAKAWQAMRDEAGTGRETVLKFFGSDRDAGAVDMSRANAERAGVTAITEFRQQAVSELTRPEGPAGIVIVNPPYGTRIGDKNALSPLYRALGQTLRERFSGWRVGLITTDAGLARATGLKFKPPGPPALHGGLRVTLFETSALP